MIQWVSLLKKEIMFDRLKLDDRVILVKYIDEVELSNKSINILLKMITRNNLNLVCGFIFDFNVYSTRNVQ